MILVLAVDPALESNRVLVDGDGEAVVDYTMGPSGPRLASPQHGGERQDLLRRRRPTGPRPGRSFVLHRPSRMPIESRR